MLFNLLKCRPPSKAPDDVPLHQKQSSCHTPMLLCKQSVQPTVPATRLASLMFSAREATPHRRTPMAVGGCWGPSGIVSHMGAQTRDAREAQHDCHGGFDLDDCTLTILFTKSSVARQERRPLGKQARRPSNSDPPHLPVLDVLEFAQSGATRNMFATVRHKYAAPGSPCRRNVLHPAHGGVENPG